MKTTETKPDLSNEVTVFVITVGAPAFGECMRRIETQDCTFGLEIVSHVAPMSKALQRMLDSCRTPYFVQVDEDMLLYPHAIRMLHERITACPAEVAIFTCHLFDVHAQRLIYGLKIYRHEIVRRYPYRDVEACEFDQIRRFTEDGFVDCRVPMEDPTQDSEATLGLHDAYWTPRSIFERYATLERKRRRHTAARPTTAAHWVRDHARVFLDRFLAEGEELDFYAFMGVVAGALAPLDGQGTEKDYRTYDQLPGFGHLCQFIDDVKQSSSS